MRIISGRAKGLTLKGPPAKSSFLRPTSDRSREALFSILGRRLAGARVLDLFAGTGALGLEALSRGSLSAVFVDNNQHSLHILRSNAAAFGASFAADETCPEISIIKYDLRGGVDRLFTSLLDQKDGFDLVFLDPPYDKGLARKTLEQLAACCQLREDGLIIVEERAKTVMPEQVDTLSLHDSRRYGDTGFWMYARHHNTTNPPLTNQA